MFFSYNSSAALILNFSSASLSSSLFPEPELLVLLNPLPVPALGFPLIYLVESTVLNELTPCLVWDSLSAGSLLTIIFDDLGITVVSSLISSSLLVSELSGSLKSFKMK